MQKVGAAFSLPDSSLQLFAAVLRSLHLSEAEGRFFSCLAARQLRVAVDLLSADVFPNAFLHSSRIQIPSKKNSEDLL